MSIALIALIVVFVVGYIAIATEHNIRIDKTASAILTAVFCWTIYAVYAPELVSPEHIPGWFMEEHSTLTAAQLATEWVTRYQILEFLGQISSILFFLLGAMTIVELVDVYGGFTIITDHINSRSTVKLLWIIGLIAFFLSAALDNLTTTIVMISLIRKLIKDKHDRLFFAGIIVIAANAGGAWSPIGDVTTTMLWIGNQITTLNIIRELIIPSLLVLAVPLLFLTFSLKGKTITPPEKSEHAKRDFNIPDHHRNIIFFVGMAGLLFVPVFKTLTHLPPFMGMMLSLSVLWVTSEILNEDRDQAMDSGLHIVKVLKRIDSASVLFFLGILLAVGSLEATGLLRSLATWLDHSIGNMDVIVYVIGLVSSVVDNVPLVAASMGMYDLAQYPTDSRLWEFLAFAAGTGGSCLIIGSAAGVAAMGMERINFFWYMKKMSPLALLGYTAGSLYYLFVGAN